MGFLLKLFTGNPLSMLWIAGGIAAVSLSIGAGGAWTIQGYRLDACKSEVRADKWLIQGLGNQIEQQNAAVKALEQATKNAKAKGAKATEAAQNTVKTLQSEVDRLAGLLKQPDRLSRTCADGARDARIGLRP
jgi:hypothetical protein